MLSVNMIGIFNMIKNFEKHSSKGSNILNMSLIYGLTNPKLELYIKKITLNLWFFKGKLNSND